MSVEIKTCEFPGCSRHPEKNGYCIGHRIYSNAPVVKEKPKAIPKRSEKMQETMKSLKKDYNIFLAKPENKLCKLRIDAECTKQATAVHHLKGRTGKNLTDQHFWLPSCSHCNNQVEKKDAEAREKGLKLSKHEPNYKRIK
jgi:hypothetical protein